MDPAIESISRVIRGSVRTDPASRRRFARDASHVAGTAVAVVAPRDTEDVVALVRWARANAVPLVARGAGTSLDGESVPVLGGVVVDLSGWNSVIEVRPEERWARVGPGTVNHDLQTAVAPHGLFFPPNPGSWTVSTIGGNVGTNASGPRSYRYGSTRSWVRAVDAVLGSGEFVRWGTRVEKRSVGPDLLSIFVGSEGTLGIATEVTVRLAVLPPIRRWIVVPLPAGHKLVPIVAALSAALGTGLSAIEFLDAAGAAELTGAAGVDPHPSRPLLFLEIEADGAAEVAARVGRVRTVLRDGGVPAEPTVYEDADALWTLRGRAGVALDKRLGSRVREDVAVPLGEVDRLIGMLERIAESEHVPLYLFGHLGEGSLHPNFAIDPASPAGERIRTAVLAASRSLGGTISGEHGIGFVKASFLEGEIGSAGLRLLRTVKQACDPDGILNPGKLYASVPEAGRLSPSPSGAAADPARKR